MARLPLVALVGVLLLAAGCGATRTQEAAVVATVRPQPPALATVAPAEPTIEATASPTVTAIVPPQPSASPTPSTTPPALGMGARFPDALALVESASPRVGVAVLTPDGTRYAGGDEGTFALASVAKLPVMIATLERARLEQRELTTRERSLLELMITVSSNAATDSLWESLGSGEGVAAILAPYGITSIEFAPDHQWGDSRATPIAIAQLLELLIDDDSPLAPAVRSEALALMRAVVADQRWGASGGIDLGDGDAVTLAIKNGWYPETSGWLLNTAAVISLSADGTAASDYIVVVLSEGATTQTEGVRTIEEIAAAINHELVPVALAVLPNPPTFAASPSAEDEPDEGETEPPEATPTPVPEPTPPPVALVASNQSSDVLVPSTGSLVGTDATASQLTLWYELPAAEANAVLESYADSMTQLGWLPVSGPPSVVLSKSTEGRWVGLSAYPASPGARLIEVTISPAPGIVPAGR